MTKLAQSEPNCEALKNAFTLLYAYRNEYFKAREGLDWMVAWSLQTEELVGPAGQKLRELERSLENVSDEFYRATAHGRDGRAYHSTKCKKVSSGFFGGSIKGYCQLVGDV